MLNLPDIIHVLVIWGVLTLLISLLALIVHSASAYNQRKRFWRALLLALGVTYVLSALLSLILHVDTILILMVSLIVAFIIQGDVGLHASDASPSEDAEDQEEETLMQAKKAEDAGKKTPVQVEEAGDQEMEPIVPYMYTHGDNIK
jgi:heme A synthase